MFDLGFMELMVIGVVALIVVGPKDLPGMFRTVGNFVGKAKGMAREFSRAMNEAADDSGVNEVGKMLKTASNPIKTVADEVRSSSESFVQQTMNSGKPKDEVEAEAKPADEVAKPTDEKPAKKPAAKKPAAKKPAAKKPAAKATSAKTTSKSTSAKPKTGAKKPAAKKPAAKASTAKSASKSTAKKPAAKKPAAKKTTKAAEDKA
ncbi:Sec-independent protein translocase protein TatB [Roseovarius albus]|uniref:Sec-independent protein translocase protein TatB n=1 Tax=Roseovarius albus TaxID=1247867 RepID=A0A1X6ZCE8_9RHOB|nr:Sec-independent protein translocase protein TatB [Roseovarius albus]SLN47190.1 Sec-independent protein translocase protein TatB [Roseovarius albus]